MSRAIMIYPNPYDAVAEENSPTRDVLQSCLIFFTVTSPPLAFLSVARVLAVRQVSMHKLAGVYGEIPAAYGAFFLFNITVAIIFGVVITLAMSRYREVKHGTRHFAFLLSGAFTIQYAIWMLEMNGRR
jgi:hypothetical protein